MTSIIGHKGSYNELKLISTLMPVAKSISTRTKRHSTSGFGPNWRITYCRVQAIQKIQIVSKVLRVRAQPPESICNRCHQIKHVSHPTLHPLIIICGTFMRRTRPPARFFYFYTMPQNARQDLGNVLSLDTARLSKIYTITLKNAKIILVRLNAFYNPPVVPLLHLVRRSKGSWPICKIVKMYAACSVNRPGD